MKNPIKVTIEKVTNYGIQFHQNHYSIYVKLTDKVAALNLTAGQHIWVNVWLSKKETVLNEQLSNVENAEVAIKATIDIKQNKDFYNCRALEFEK